MNIQKIIDTLLANSAEIMKAYPTVKNIRHEIKDIPYSDLLVFSKQHQETIRTNHEQKRVYIIHSPMEACKMHSDIWLYSTIITIKPAEIIAD